MSDNQQLKNKFMIHPKSGNKANTYDKIQQYTST